MNICILMPSFEEGGVQRLVDKLYHGFKENGHNVTLLVGDANGKMKKRFAEKDTIDLKKTRWHGDYKILFAKNKIKKHLIKNNFNIILAVPGFSTVMATLLKKNVFSSKVLVMIDDKPSLLLKRGLKYKIIYHLYKKFYKNADMVIATHDCGLKDIVKNYHIERGKLRMVYYPIVDFDEIASSENYNHRWLRDKNYVFLSIGRLMRDKDFATLIRAFSLAKQQIPNAKLLIAGEGTERSLLEGLIRNEGLENDVELLGHVDNVYGLLKAVDAFVSSSVYEPFGIAIIEALACNTTVISTDTESGAQREILCGGKYGKLCAVRNENDLAKKMVECYHSKTPNNGIVRARDFEIKKAIGNYISLFEDLLQ